jgi:uncharacterized phage protein (TIGR02220 family)
MRFCNLILEKEMKYTLVINQKQSIELGITNVNQSLILGLIADAHTWAEHELVDGQIYYWTARQAIAKEIPLANLKPDSVYRHLKKLSELGLIDYVKNGKKDCCRLTKLGKSYYVGNESEISKNSEINPSKFGNKSEKDSEINPTYQYTNINSNTNISEIIADLNKKANTSYRANSEATKKLINTRLKEGFTVDDFFKVHTIKCNEWGSSQDMSRFLRPSTLYGSKFESYLNTPDVNSFAPKEYKGPATKESTEDIVRRRYATSIQSENNNYIDIDYS